jgi:hypothetical protein
MPKKENEKTVEVVIDPDKPDEKTTIVVQRPSNRVQTEAARIGALVWTKCIKDGVMTKQELDKFMKEKGIWGVDKEKEKDDVAEAINDLEKELYLGNSDASVKRGTRKKRIKLSDAKDIALKMRRKRAKLRDLLAEKITLETNTAESLSENAKFDYIVAHCTFDDKGNKIYDSVEDYEKQAEDAIAYQAAASIAEMMYAINKDFEAKLPENRFLSKFQMVNSDLSLINSEGHTVDTKGNLINNVGEYLASDGSRVDIHGNPLDGDGNYEFAVDFIDDDGSKVKLEKVKKDIEETETQPVTETQDTTEN